MSEKVIDNPNIPLDEWPELDRMGVIVSRMTADRPLEVFTREESKPPKTSRLTRALKRLWSKV